MRCLAVPPLDASKWGILFLSILFLSACSTLKELQPPLAAALTKQAAWQVHRANLETIHGWDLTGRVAGRTSDEGFRTKVHWRQQQQQFSIDLHDPLGRKVAVITGKQAHVELNTSKGESYSAKDSETLMRELFGYALPVNGLRYWMRGIPDPRQVYTSMELDDQGHLKQLQQGGWVVDYERYHEGKPALPAFIKISSQSLHAKIVIDHWILRFAEP